MLERGYAIIEDVFTHSECDEIVGFFADLEGRPNRAGIRNLMSHSVVREIANDRRLISLTERIAGSELIPFKATLFTKAGKANWLVAWHQDTALPVEGPVATAGWGSGSTKEGVLYAHAPTSALRQIVAIRIHLDRSRKENGPLRVIPDTHRERLTGDVDLAELAESVECPVGKGGVIAMSPLILHASSKCLNDEPRRVLHIEYAPTLDIEHGVRLAVR